jgi:DNA-binding HxlR family transcriptional regulator
MADPTIRENLDSMSVKILEVLENHGGTATTTEIKNSLGHETNNFVNYRKRAHLEPAGLIDTFQPESESPGNIPALEWSLTEKGLEFLEELDEDSRSPRDLGERVELIEDQISAIQESLAELDEGEKHNGTDDTESEQIMELIEAVERVESRLDGIESNPIFDEDMQFQMDSIMGFAGVVKEDYLEEMEQDELSEQIKSRWEMIDTFRDH